jgi:hypothetical protein
MGLHSAAALAGYSLGIDWDTVGIDEQVQSLPAVQADARADGAQTSNFGLFNSPQDLF